MTLTERPSALSERVRVQEAVRTLKPGESFSLGRPITVEEFCDWLDEEVRAELIDGVISMTPPPSDPHEDLQGWFHGLLRMFVDARGLGKVRGSRSGVRLSTTTLREPDIAFFSTGHLDRMERSGIHGAPDLAIEIVDSDQARRDAARKETQYRDAGVPEILILDLPRRHIRHVILDQGRYAVLEPDLSVDLELRTVPGFRLRGSWLFDGPEFPQGLEVLLALLKE
jgi:Uma2 family endonuclease